MKTKLNHSKPFVRVDCNPSKSSKGIRQGYMLSPVNSCGEYIIKESMDRLSVKLQSEEDE